MTHRSLIQCPVGTSVSLFLLVCLLIPTPGSVFAEPNASARPNILFVLTDDHRWDAVGAAQQSPVRTPNLDRISNRGTRFSNAFVTLAICSPSRAACLTGRYGSVNGVTAVGKHGLNEGESTFATALRERGYQTGVAGKWHLSTKPDACGFDFASTCWANGTWYDRRFNINGQSKVMAGFVDDVTADESIRFIKTAISNQKPFLLWMCTQVPHMDHRHTWPARERYLSHYPAGKMPLPSTWNDDLQGRPEYLRTARNRTAALTYGYDSPDAIREHARDYFASVEQMDAAVGRVLKSLDEQGLAENTWVIFMGDNGWFLGEHGMTSKVLPYEESMRVPMSISGPGVIQGVNEELVLNIDLTATLYEIAGLPCPESVQGRSLLPLLGFNGPDIDQARGSSVRPWRDSFLYEAPTPQLGSRPLWAVRDSRWKYIETKTDGDTFKELYDLKGDNTEIRNLAGKPEHRGVQNRLAERLKEHVRLVATQKPPNQTSVPRTAETGLKTKPTPVRTDLEISGVYPHLTTYGVYSENGGHYKKGHNECGIGAVVPWAGKLWMVNYAPHMPRGSEHKLFSVDEDISKPMVVHPESVGGTPAGRMIHEESRQLLIGHHLIDDRGKIRTISPGEMPIRVTAIARHLKDPANFVYYIDMEGSIWEANVHSLDVKRLFKKPVPGWHGKGGYTSQGRLVISNNGELHVGDYKDVLVGGKAENEEERGVLAEFDGQDWTIIERRQFTEVTGPKGIVGGSDGDDPIWTIGWDRRSVRLKVLDHGHWSTYLLPKAAYCNDASHGWYTEWPRIREVTNGRWILDMHGMFYDFPKSFSESNTAGIRPIASHLRYVPDFCAFGERLVLASDETSIQGNPLAGQPQSNLWFGSMDDLKSWGPVSAYGGPWVEDNVQANSPSDPFLVAGFSRRVLHLAVGKRAVPSPEILRASDQQPINQLPDSLRSLPRVTTQRGDWHHPANGFEFIVDQPVTVYLCVDVRGDPVLDPKWRQTDLETTWGKGFRDRVYSRDFQPGTIVIPGNVTEHTPGSFGMPHMAVVQTSATQEVNIVAGKQATVHDRPKAVTRAVGDSPPVRFTVQIDRAGNGNWSDLMQIPVESDGATFRVLPESLDAEWLRLTVDRDCVATAFLHQTSPRSVDPAESQNTILFQGLAEIDQPDDAIGGHVYAAKRNRDLRFITSDDDVYEFSKSNFEFRKDEPDLALKKLLHVEPEFQVDEASVILQSQGKTLRLPKGHHAFDKPFSAGWPRASREVQSERHLANIHGTFYEVPLVTNGAPPNWQRMRPVSSHSKQIIDFCSWNGLLVLSGVRRGATEDGHVFRGDQPGAALWFGGIDDLWKLGKPVGHGGPWMHSPVRANVPSDPYLMTGYDSKDVVMTNEGPQETELTLQVDVDGTGLWLDYQVFLLPPGRDVKHAFPSGFSACWVRAVSDCDTQLSVQLRYQ